MNETPRDPVPAREVPERTWRRVYVLVVVYGLLTIAALWWLTATFDV